MFQSAGHPRVKGIWKTNFQNLKIVFSAPSVKEKSTSDTEPLQREFNFFTELVRQGSHPVSKNSLVSTKFHYES